MFVSAGERTFHAACPCALENPLGIRAMHSSESFFVLTSLASLVSRNERLWNANVTSACVALAGYQRERYASVEELFTARRRDRCWYDHGLGAWRRHLPMPRP